MMPRLAQTCLLLVFLLTVLSASACQNKLEPVTDKQQARVLLNDNLYAQARDLLIRLHQEHPDDDEVMVLLASAHAGLAGLNVIQAWRMFEPLVFKDTALSLVEEQDTGAEAGDQNPDEDLSKEPNPFEGETYRFLADIARNFNLLGRMPRFNLSGRSEINEALRVLALVPPGADSYFKAKLYSVFLNLFQFSGMLRDSFPEVPEGQDYDLQTVLCEFNPYLFVRNVDVGLLHMSNALSDIKAASEVEQLRGEVKFEKIEESLKKIVTLKDQGDAHVGEILAGKSALNKALCEKTL